MSGDRSWSTSGIDEKALAALAEELPASVVWPLLLVIVERRAARRAPRDLRAQWAHDRFTQPAAIDPRRMLAIDAMLFGEHIQTHLAALDRLEPNGYMFADREIRVLASSERADAADSIAARCTGITVVRDVLEHPYYDGLRFTITARPPDGGEPPPLIDGGAFNWLGTLTSNHRLAFVASGMGSQMVAVRYRAPDL